MVVDEKDKIKKEIIKKINDILINNEIKEIDSLTVIKQNNQTSYLGNIAVFDYDKIETIEKQLNETFKDYTSNSIRTEEVVSCCKPPYKNISFKVNIAN